MTVPVAGTDPKQIIVVDRAPIACFKARLCDYQRSEDIVLRLILSGHLPALLDKIPLFAGVFAFHESTVCIEYALDPIDLVGSACAHGTDSALSAFLAEIILITDSDAL